jgi:hypothetical protein
MENLITQPETMLVTKQSEHMINNNILKLGINSCGNSASNM